MSNHLDQMQHPLQRSLSIIREKFWSKEFLRYFIVGSTSVILDIATLFILKELLHLSALVALLINQLLIYNYVFFLNKFWVFSSQQMLVGQMIRYYTLAAANYVVALSWMWFFEGMLDQNYILVRIANIILATLWNFLLYKHFVYRNTSSLVNGA